MPIGVSFFTFKMISYQADLYTGKIEKDPGFLETAAYFCMFPQVVSGPIMRFSEYQKKTFFQKKEDIFPAIEDGLRFFVLGLGMKVLLADHLSMLWNDIGTIG